jgi:hypothetical protein
MEEDDITGLEAGTMMVIDEMIINRYKEDDTTMMVIDGMIMIEIEITTIPAVTITHEIIVTT